MRRRTKKGIEVTLTIVGAAVPSFLSWLDGGMDTKHFIGTAVASMIIAAKAALTTAPKDTTNE